MSCLLSAAHASCFSSPMPPAISWLAHLSCQSSMLTVSGCPGTLHYFCVLPPAATHSPLWFANFSCPCSHHSHFLHLLHCSSSLGCQAQSLILNPRAFSVCDLLPFAEISRLSYKCWIESLPFLERSWPHVLSQIFFLRKEWLLGRKLIDWLLQILFLIMLIAQGRRHTMNPLPPSSFWAALKPSLSPELVMVHMHYSSWLFFKCGCQPCTCENNAILNPEKRLCIEVCILSYFCRKHFPHNGWTACL